MEGEKTTENARIFDREIIGHNFTRSGAESSPLETEPLVKNAASDQPLSKKFSTLNDRFRFEVDQIKEKTGGLEAIRKTLGLSQRRICLLLLVDPSAWTRWNKTGQDAPPHVYRALQWLLALQDRYPELKNPYWLAGLVQTNHPPPSGIAEFEKTHQEIQKLKAAVASFKSEVNAREMTRITLEDEIIRLRSQADSATQLAQALSKSLITEAPAVESKLQASHEMPAVHLESAATVSHEIPGESDSLNIKRWAGAALIFASGAAIGMILTMAF